MSINVFDVTPEFIKEVITHFEPWYKDVDKGHGLKHVSEVMYLALDINKKLQLTARNDIIVIAAIAHDMFSFTDRELHHEKAAEYILTTEDTFITNYPYEDRLIISAAIREHRGSYKGKYTTIVSDIISAADRGKPNVKDIIKRIHNCSKDLRLQKGFKADFILDKNSTEEMFLERTLSHLQKKFGKNGYARYNYVYKLMFGYELENMQNIIETFGIKDINNMVSDIRCC